MTGPNDGCWQDREALPPLPIILVVAGALVDPDDRVLIARRPAGQRWVSVSGCSF